MFNRTSESEKLIRFLASARAQEIRPRGGGAFSVNRKVPSAVYGDEVSRKIAATLTTAGTFCFDASDLMPGVMRTAFYRAALEYVNDPTRLDTVLTQLDAVRTQHCGSGGARHTLPTSEVRPSVAGGSANVLA